MRPKTYEAVFKGESPKRTFSAAMPIAIALSSPSTSGNLLSRAAVSFDSKKSEKEENMAYSSCP
eukprot:4929152-Pleurochrysis_carterae.AAC.1